MMEPGLKVGGAKSEDALIQSTGLKVGGGAKSEDASQVKSEVSLDPVHLHLLPVEDGFKKRATLLAFISGCGDQHRNIND